MKRISLEDMARARVVALGGEGLYYEDCGCTLDDFMPCGNPYPDCEVAKKAEFDGTNAMPGSDVSFGDEIMIPIDFDKKS